MFIKIAVESITPLTIAAGRIVIGAIVMALIAHKMKAKLPQKTSEWIFCALIGFTGNVIPFFLANWSVQYVHSSLAAICMSLLPLFTLILAHFMTHDEKFNIHKLIGVIFGILGVASLFYGTVTEVDNSLILYLALFGLLLTSFAYALSGVLIRKLNNKDPFGTSTAMLIMSSLITVPLALIIEQPWTLTPSASALYSVVVLGVFSTGIASLLLFHLTHLTGATFASYNTYLIPLVGMAAGYIWMDEPLKMTYFISIAFIFAGIYLAEKRKSADKISS